jgi:Protein of unknown function (DUF2793)
MKYQPPFGSVDPNAPYINGNPVIGLAGSIIPASAIQEPQTEIVNAIIAAGLVPSDGTPLNQLTQAIELLGRIPFCLDGGVANALVINPVPPITAYGGAGLTNAVIFAVQVAQTCVAGGCTVNASGLGNLQLQYQSGSPLKAGDLVAGGVILISENASGSAFQLLSTPGSLEFPNPQQLWHYGVDIGTVNNVVVNIDAIGNSIPTGMALGVKVAHTNTSATVTCVVNGLTAVNITRGSGGGLEAGDIGAGWIALMEFDGTEFQLLNLLNGASGGAGGNDITGPDRPYWLAVNSATTTAPPGSPSLGDTYLIPSGATGSWSGLSGRLAQWNGTAWVYRSYPAGSIVVASDTMLPFQCTVAGTTWQAIEIMTPGRMFFYANF